jgi:hypothetical protein
MGLIGHYGASPFSCDLRFPVPVDRMSTNDRAGQTFVQVKGERFYLGKFGTEESRMELWTWFKYNRESPSPA